MIKIHLLDEPTKPAKLLLLNQSNLEFVSNPNDADIIYTQLTPISTNVPVFSPCTGTDHIKSPHIVHLDQHWKENEGRNVTSTAEHTFSLILQLAKRSHIQLKNKTLGIIGQGRIGRMVTEYALNFGMNVIGIDPMLANMDRSSELLIHSDIITIHVPYNESTHHLIGHPELLKMKSNVILVNTSRPDVVDIDALTTALNILNITYGNDFDQLKDHPNVIATSHVAGNSIDARIATDIYVANKICEYVNNVIHTSESNSNLDQTINI